MDPKRARALIEEVYAEIRARKKRSLSRLKPLGVGMAIGLTTMAANVEGAEPKLEAVEVVGDEPVALYAAYIEPELAPPPADSVEEDGASDLYGVVVEEPQEPVEPKDPVEPEVEPKDPVEPEVEPPAELYGVPLDPEEVLDEPYETPLYPEEVDLYGMVVEDPPLPIEEGADLYGITVEEEQEPVDKPEDPCD